MDAPGSESREALIAGVERLRRQQATLVALTRSDLFRTEDPAVALARITEASARTLGVQRVSVWRYNAERTAIRCDDLFELVPGRHSTGLELPAAPFPAYFRALAEMDVIPADDAARDPRTCEFRDSYLAPLGITSMMDAPLHLRGALEGVLCHEHVGPMRHWSPDEQTFAVATANLVSLALEQRERRRTEEELRGAKATAEAALKELEAFSYSVAHDLRSPLSAMDGFSQVLLDEYAARLDETGADFLRRVRAASRRMGRLIDDLLALSRVTRAEMKREPVDLSALAQAIVEDLRAREPERRVEVALAAGLAATGDGRLLRVALENLIGNAWKFTSAHPQARIEFGVRERNGERAYFVRDDGAGFDMAYAVKLFQPFQRLHSAAEFPGSGVGLATVHRVVQRHGGRVWAEGAVERGATFFFTL